MIKRGVQPKYSDDGTVVINQKCIRDFRIDYSVVRHHNESVRRTPTDRFLRRWDVLVNSTGVGTLGRVAQVTADVVETTADSHVTIVRPDPSVVDERYFGYCLKWLQPHIERMAEGATGQTELSRQRLGDELQIPVPALRTQQTIGQTLLTFDDLIENNRKRIELLEESARFLYREWFANFRYPGHEEVPLVDSELGPIPEGWGTDRCVDLLDVVLGGTPSKKTKRYWEGGTVPWVTSTVVNQMRVDSPSELITEEALESCTTKLVPSRSTMIAITGATLGQLSLSEFECCTNQSLVSITDRSFHSAEYWYLQMAHRIQHLVNLATGSAQQHINKGDVEDFLLLKPEEPVLRRFQSLVLPLFDQLRLLSLSLRVLEEARDLLLPRLVSGDLDVSDLDLGLEAVG